MIVWLITDGAMQPVAVFSSKAKADAYVAAQAASPVVVSGRVLDSRQDVTDWSVDRWVVDEEDAYGRSVQTRPPS